MPMQAQKEGGFIAPTLSNLVNSRGREFNATLQPLFTGSAPVTIVQDVGWVSGPVWTSRNISPVSGFNPQNVHPVASRYIGCTVLAAV